MTELRNRYFSFSGRVARIPFFVRGIYLSIGTLVLVIASVPLFANGNQVLWWTGLALVAVAIGVPGMSMISLFVRRLHDLGRSGYHAIWIVPAELGWTGLSYGPAEAQWLGLPLLAVSIWLTFYPGNGGDNRFGNP
jgi:uncharacterized membrane protein YhaH (DUF805 family)